MSAAFCTHPLCDEGLNPHPHLYMSHQCNRGIHSRCPGSYTSSQSLEPTEKSTLRRMALLNKPGLTMDDPEYWRISDRQRAIYEDYVKRRDGKHVRKLGNAPKVWSCKCECHEGRRWRWVAWSVLTGGRKRLWQIKSPSSTVNGSESEARRQSEYGRLSRLPKAVSMFRQIPLERNRHGVYGHSAVNFFQCLSDATDTSGACDPKDTKGIAGSGLRPRTAARRKGIGARSSSASTIRTGSIRTDD